LTSIRYSLLLPKSWTLIFFLLIIPLFILCCSNNVYFKLMSLYILQFSSYMKFTPFLIWVCGTEFWWSQIPAPATKVRDTRFPWRSQRDSNKLGRIRYQSQVTNSHILFTPCFARASAMKLPSLGTWEDFTKHKVEK
jgi:hypothetical protein